MLSPQAQRLKDLARIVNGQEEGSIIVMHTTIFIMTELPTPMPWRSVGGRRFSDMAVALRLRWCEDVGESWWAF